MELGRIVLCINNTGTWHYYLSTNTEEMQMIAVKVYMII